MKLSIVFLLGCSLAESLCDLYTTALLVNNTAENQYTLMTLLVNTAVIGNYTATNTGVVVPGILSPGTLNGTEVSLLQYFTGKFNTTNVNGSPGMVNFLDDGGAAPLLLNKPANGTSSNQYFLLTHLYELFGKLLGCSMSPTYSGDISMYETHKFMELSYVQVAYFIEQVGLSAKSFGVTCTDVTAIVAGLNNLFNNKCDVPKSIAGGSTAPQSICNGSDCPLAPNATCSVTSTNSTITNSTKTNFQHISVWLILIFSALL